MTIEDWIFGVLIIIVMFLILTSLHIVGKLEKILELLEKEKPK